MDKENANMTAVDTATTTGAGDAATQKEPPALVKKFGKMTYWFILIGVKLYKEDRM